MLKRLTTDQAPPALPAERRRQQRELMAEADRLYETYVKPLEREHWGEFVAVTRDGKLAIGLSHRETLRQAVESLGHGSFLFKVGERAVGKVR